MAGLESRCGASHHQGFESLTFRHKGPDQLFSLLESEPDRGLSSFWKAGGHCADTEKRLWRIKEQLGRQGATNILHEQHQVKFVRR